LLGKSHKEAEETVKRMMVFFSTFFLLLSIISFDGFVMVKSETEEAGFIVKMSVTYHNNGFSQMKTALSAYS
jgi:hypothetical protein